MNRQDFNALEYRIRARADRLWETAGRPQGSRDGYMENARELIAIEEVELPKLDPEQAAGPVIEESSIQGNLGEFPTLRDQGDEQTYPHLPGDDEIHLSDSDASDSGGVLPEEDMPDDELSEVSLADGDITSSSVDADDDPQNDDLNDDGMPDPTDLDAEAEMDEDDEYDYAAASLDEDQDDDELVNRIRGSLSGG